jgi:ATP-dependent Clp protease, protease subunit
MGGQRDMGTAHIFFGKAITPDTSTALIAVSRALMGERAAPNGPFLWDHLHYSISSGGGDIIASFAAFNEMKGMPLKITTHNSGAIDSAAIMPFMVGERRTASPASAFFFHQVRWNFPANANVPIVVINEATTWLGVYESMMADFVAAQSGLKKKKVLDMMHAGTSVSSEEAKTMGLIHDVCECSIPQDARSYQV